MQEEALTSFTVYDSHRNSCKISDALNSVTHGLSLYQVTVFYNCVTLILTKF